MLHERVVLILAVSGTIAGVVGNRGVRTLEELCIDRAILACSVYETPQSGAKSIPGGLAVKTEIAKLLVRVPGSLPVLVLLPSLVVTQELFGGGRVCWGTRLRSVSYFNKIDYFSKSLWSDYVQLLQCRLFTLPESLVCLRRPKV